MTVSVPASRCPGGTSTTLPAAWLTLACVCAQPKVAAAKKPKAAAKTAVKKAPTKKVPPMHCCV